MSKFQTRYVPVFLILVVLGLIVFSTTQASGGETWDTFTSWADNKWERATGWMSDLTDSGTDKALGWKKICPGFDAGEKPASVDNLNCPDCAKKYFGTQDPSKIGLSLNKVQEAMWIKDAIKEYKDQLFGRVHKLNQIEIGLDSCNLKDKPEAKRQYCNLRSDFQMYVFLKKTERAIEAACVAVTTPQIQKCKSVADEIYKKYNCRAPTYGKLSFEFKNKDELLAAQGQLLVESPLLASDGFQDKADDIVDKWFKSTVKMQVSGKNSCEENKKILATYPDARMSAAPSQELDSCYSIEESDRLFETVKDLKPEYQENLLTTSAAQFAEDINKKLQGFCKKDKGRFKDEFNNLLIGSKKDNLETAKFLTEVENEENGNGIQSMYRKKGLLAAMIHTTNPEKSGDHYGEARCRLQRDVWQEEAVRYFYYMPGVVAGMMVPGLGAKTVFQLAKISQKLAKIGKVLAVGAGIAGVEAQFMLLDINDSKRLKAKCDGLEMEMEVAGPSKQRTAELQECLDEHKWSRRMAFVSPFMAAFGLNMGARELRNLRATQMSKQLDNIFQNQSKLAKIKGSSRSVASLEKTFAGLSQARVGAITKEYKDVLKAYKAGTPEYKRALAIIDNLEKKWLTRGGKPDKTAIKNLFSEIEGGFDINGKHARRLLTDSTASDDLAAVAGEAAHMGDQANTRLVDKLLGSNEQAVKRIKTDARYKRLIDTVDQAEQDTATAIIVTLERRGMTPDKIEEEFKQISKSCGI